jgi:carboxyvinyl-carboxyphosphonate phosphorylmutase
MTSLTERRQRLRAVLNDDACHSPAPVFDPLSARAATDLGFEVLMLPGSTASALVLGAPDVVVLTLTEFAEQARRITRVSLLPLLVDADHGYGNALGVMRCVEELEAAGVAGLTIEDTALPRPYGARADTVIPLPEMLGKLHAAVAARTDPATVILGRTSALRAEGLDGCRERIAAYAETGVDGIFLAPGPRERVQLEAIRAATSLPLVLGSGAPELNDRAYLASQGVRLLLQGHAPFRAAVKAMYEALRALRAGASPESLAASGASTDLLARLTDQAAYDERQAAYLGGGSGET